MPKPSAVNERLGNLGGTIRVIKSQFVTPVKGSLFSVVHQEYLSGSSIYTVMPLL